MLPSKNKLITSAFFISGLTTLTLLLAFLVQLILARKFGASFEMDAYFAALVLPTITVRIFGIPLNAAFIPLYHETKTKDGPAQATQFYRLTFWLFLAFYLLTALGLTLLAAPIAGLIIPGSGSQTQVLTGTLLRLTALWAFLNGLYYTTQTLHLVKESFLIPYLANALGALVTLITTFYLIQNFGMAGAAWALILGTGIAALVSLWYLPEKISLDFCVNWVVLKRFFALFLPISLGSLIYRSTPLIDKYFASFLPSGQISILSYGYRVLEALVTLLATGLAVILLPISSKLSARQDRHHLERYFSLTIRSLGFLILPVLIYLSFFSQELIRVIFERGSFTSGDSQKVARVLTSYGGALLALAIGGQLTTILYAQKKQLLVVAINLILLPCYVLLVYFLSTALGTRGIALAYSILTGATCLVYAFFLRQTFAKVWAEILRSFTKFSLAALGMLAWLWLSNFYLPFKNEKYFYFGFQVLSGGLVYLSLLGFLKTSELQALLNLAKEKLTLK